MTQNKPAIGLTRKLPDSVEAYLEKHYTLKRSSDEVTLNTTEMIDFAQGMDGLLVTSADKLLSDVITGLPDSVRIIATYSVGYDHIDVDAAKNRNIIVTNTPGVLSDATADIALLLLLGAARGAREAEEAIRENTWPGWLPTTFVGLDLMGKNLGIYGMGRIGQAVAKRAVGFGLNIHYHNRKPVEGVPDSYQYHDTLEGLMKEASYLSINCASTDDTRGSINAASLSHLPENAVIINTARGDIIVDDDLINALTSRKLFAAGLDVYAGEPALDPRYRQLKNTFLFPHIGSGTRETRHNMGMLAAKNLDAIFAGNAPPNSL